ncbi:MAG: phage recombination protein Bet [Simkaniaceae bacterium]|nr:phage recombination protein Bet [Candidatus Sacchlamyda saccharinae]
MAVQLNPPPHASESFSIDSSKLDLIKRTICKGATDDELQLFIHACKKTGLDPFMRQIFAVKRWDASAKREVMTIQTGIDGYRLIADRTGKYAPGRDTEFGYDTEGRLQWAKAYIKKMTPDGQWHEISAIAFWGEYVQTTRDGKPTVFWQKKGHIMLSKCAEALALRKTFPAELSGIYTKEEMSQEMCSTPEEPIATISVDEASQLQEMINGDAEFENKLLTRLKSAFGCNALIELPKDQFENVKKVIRQHQEAK